MIKQNSFSNSIISHLAYDYKPPCFCWSPVCPGPVTDAKRRDETLKRRDLAAACRDEMANQRGFMIKRRDGTAKQRAWIAYRREGDATRRNFAAKRRDKTTTPGDWAAKRRAAKAAQIGFKRQRRDEGIKRRDAAAKHRDETPFPAKNAPACFENGHCWMI